ncbi:MAG: hypothetical protein Q4C44_02850 [bacterium]|nr:hypothetical protein [bacterium]
MGREYDFFSRMDRIAMALERQNELLEEANKLKRAELELKLSISELGKTNEESKQIRQK